MLKISTCWMQEVLMFMLRRRQGPAQLSLFACHHSNPGSSPPWTALSTDVQQEIVRLLAQLLQHHCASFRATEVAGEVGDE
jgi:hypothetical protein